MSEERIHPTAVVHPTARLAEDVVIEPYAIINEGVEIGAGSRIGSFSTIGPWVKMGERNRIFAHASIGADPQDLTYSDGEETWLIMGDDNRIREFVTLNRGTLKGDGTTRVGSNCLLMACCHIAHDCRIGDHVILANNALLAGHVTVEDRAIINGSAGVQQFSIIGSLAFVGGLTRIVHDVPPFMVVEGHPSKVRKVNTVGLKRQGYDDESILALKDAYRALFRSRRPRVHALAELESGEELNPQVRQLCEFLRRIEQRQRGTLQSP